MAVLRLFMLEAIFLGLFATISGATLGGLLAVGLDAAAIPVPIEAMQAFLLSDTVRFSVRPASLVGSVLFLTTCTAVAALWPSLRAARLKPIVALGYTA
jgi:ABC-type antimicrobial peptide transport system permease subunit